MDHDISGMPWHTGSRGSAMATGEAEERVRVRACMVDSEGRVGLVRTGCG